MNENFAGGKFPLKKGFVNLHIDLETRQIYCSTRPYNSEEEAETGIFIGGSIVRLGTFEIVYPDVFVKKEAI